MCVAEPFVQIQAASACLAHRDEREVLDPAAPVSGIGLAHHLARVTDRLQIAGDDFIEPRSLRARDLCDAISWRRERHLGNDLSNVIRCDGLEEAGRHPDGIPIRT